MNDILILLAAYDGGRHIEEQIESVLAQSCEDWQLILSDDGDLTGDILQEYAKKYSGRIIHYKSGRRFGSAPRHFMHLLKNFHDADYIMFCDQDDVWHPDKIKKTLVVMKEIEGSKKKPAMVHTDLRVVDEELNELDASFWHYSNISGDSLSLNRLLVQNVVTGCTMMINKALAKLVCRNIPADDILMHDGWIALVASLFGRIGVVNEALIDYRQHTGNVVGAKNVRSGKYIKARLKGGAIKRSMKDAVRQAGQLIECFGESMTQEQFEVVEALAGIEEKGKLERIRTYNRYGLRKQSFIRRVGQLLWW
ncbi:MAG: glycosyltransferase family 2 protein [Lachnospiraceae bacterium]|jgi:glycosyltransferase involved in cell wall biosynthesis